MERPSKRWWSATASRLARLVRPSPDSLPSSTEAIAASSVTADSLQWLERVAADPHTFEVVRDHYGRRLGGQHLEFLMACTSFARARNPLQRFEQFRNIISKYVHPGAARPVQISDSHRSQLLEEWARWSQGNRLPVNLSIPALRAAIDEVQVLVIAQRP